ASPRASPSGHAESGEGVRGAARLELLDQTQLAHSCAAEVRHAVRAVRAVSGRRVNGERPLVALVDEEERLRAAGRAQRVVSSSEQSAADPAAGAGGMNEEQEHLTIARMNGGVADDAVGFVGGDQQHVRRLMIGYELFPVL